MLKLVTVLLYAPKSVWVGAASKNDLLKSIDMSKQERMLSISAALEQAEQLIVGRLLSIKASQQFAEGNISASELEPYADYIREISSGYLSERAKALPPFSSLEQATAYALYFMPINFAKVFYLLNEIPPTQSDSIVRVLDYGCGPGTASLAVRAYFGASTDLTLVDHSAVMLQTAKRILDEPDSRQVFLLPSEFERLDQSYDLIIAANVLTELPFEKRAQMVQMLGKRLTSSGALLLVEPAMLTVAREAQQLRDLIISLDPSMIPIFPCTRMDPCPMLRASADDWCHGTLRWDGSRLVRQLDALSGFNKHRLKYSAFIFKRGGVLKKGLRLLREPERKKFGFSVSVCGANCYGEKIYKKKELTEALKIELSRAQQYELLDINQE